LDVGALALALAAILAGCGGWTGRDDPARRSSQRSWAATADLLLAEWRKGHVPDRYTADTLRLAGEQLADRRVARAADAVERGDRDARVAPP
jgi:hypothetical protein